LLLQLDALREVDDAALRRRRVEEAKDAVRASLHDVRRMAQELRPEALEHLGLVSAMTQLCQTFGKQAGIVVERKLAQDLPPLSAEVELAIYRVAQESLTNVARHSHATSVGVTLARGRQSVVLRVIDNGDGISNAHADGGGIRGMRERALLAGGALAVKPGPEGGVEVRFEAPTASA
jgi:two-component system, NarL family, sensor histidine kinase UhpB